MIGSCLAGSVKVLTGAEGRRAGQAGEVRPVARILVPAVAAVSLAVAWATPTLSGRFDILPVTAAEASQRLEASTVEVVALGCDLAQRQGTAVAIAAGHVLTNEHVVGVFRSLDVAASGHPVIAASIALVNRTVDLALIDAGGLTVPPLALSPYDPEPGEGVWLAGFPHDPQGAGGTLLDDGLVVAQALVVDDARGTMRLDTPVTPGMSGGPVLDRSGRLAGLLYGVQSPTNDALVIPVSVLRSVINAGLSAGSTC